MKINRHNYEDFFLLYVDNELSAAERKTVDVFVQENPDLQQELFLLQQTVIKADDTVLEKKDWLFMEEDISVLQESLLLYADDELIPADKEAVEILLKTNKPALAEWNILQQTKLQPDTSIIFTDKQSLYRTAGGRVVGFKWWRAVAAAVLLGLGFWTGVAVYKNNFMITPEPEKIANKNSVNAGEGKTEVAGNITKAEIPAKENTVQPKTTEIAQQNQSVQVSENKIQQVEKINKQNASGPKDNIAIKTKSDKPGNNLPKPYFENINRKQSNENIVASVLPEKNNNTKVSGINDVIVKTNPVVSNLNKGNADATTTAAIQAASKITGDDNNRYMDMDDENGRRTRLSGFLRKAKRMLERTTNIKTGDGLQVAGFEIAIK